MHIQAYRNYLCSCSDSDCTADDFAALSWRASLCLFDQNCIILFTNHRWVVYGFAVENRGCMNIWGAVGGGEEESVILI